MLAEMGRGTTSMPEAMAVQMSFEVAFRLVITFLSPFRFLEYILAKRTKRVIKLVKNLCKGC